MSTQEEGHVSRKRKDEVDAAIPGPAIDPVALKIYKLHLEPGDILVVKARIRLTDKENNRVQKAIKDILESANLNNACFVTDPLAELEVRKK